MNHKPIPTLDMLSETGQTVNEALVEQTLGRFRVEYRKAGKQDELFTPNHVKYQVAIYLDEELILVADYQCNPSAVGLPDGASVLRSVIQDAQSYAEADDMAAFLCEFGYCSGNESNLRSGIKAYEACKRFHEDISNHGVSVCDIFQFFTFCEDNDINADIETVDRDADGNTVLN